MLSRAQFQRYSRQIMLPQVGKAGQQRLAQARVMIVGLGGLGSPAALYLAAAGVGELHLVDGDQIELSNLQRQILYKSNHRQKDKARVAAQQLTAANPDIRILPHVRMADAPWLQQQLSSVDLVLDCTDNFATRQLLNRCCRSAAIPLIVASVQGFSGQLISFDFRQNTSPCYACLFPPTPEADSQNPASATLPVTENCDSSGVIGPALGIIGSMQALEALKCCLSLPLSSQSKLQIFEAETLQWRQLRVSTDSQCPLCGEARSYSNVANFT